MATSELIWSSARLPKGVTRARCSKCNVGIFIVQPNIEVQLGIPADTANARCDDCYDHKRKVLLSNTLGE